jgi:putative tricarboxylic transport membrane protein
MATCLYEIVKNLFFAAGTRKGTRRGASAPGKTAPEKSYPDLLLLGMAMTAAYLFLIGIVGFLFCTFLYLLAFMYLGRYRNLKAIVWSSGIGTLVLALIFLKFVYISLPMGREPFSSATFFILRLLGIK